MGFEIIMKTISSVVGLAVKVFKKKKIGLDYHKIQWNMNFMLSSLLI
jgi:hypothetical protein